MISTTMLRIATLFAGLMGAAGVLLAAAAAHQPDAARLAAASSMLLFHAPAVLAAALLNAHGVLKRPLGAAAIIGFIAGAGLFAGDLAMRQYQGQSLFSMAAPTGGSVLILCWLLLAISAIWPPRANKS